MAVSDNLITQEELAKRLGTSTVSIGNWENKEFDDFIGPFPQGVKNGRYKEYNWKACLLWYIKYYSASNFKSMFSQVDTDFEKQKVEGDARKSLANAMLAELELQKEQGKLVLASEIEEKLSEVVLTIRQKILTITPRLTVLLTLSDEQKTVLERETLDILRELATLKNAENE